MLSGWHSLIKGKMGSLGGQCLDFQKLTGRWVFFKIVLYMWVFYPISLYYLPLLYFVSSVYNTHLVNEKDIASNFQITSVVKLL